MVAGVDSENAASLRFLAAHGFEPCGQLREVGFKFGRYLHLNFLQLFLNAPGELPDQPDQLGQARRAET
jgi:phosphinothricin acetyltransferase